MGIKNYYKILNISEKSSEEDIKKSYRKLAKIFHPDKTQDKKTEELFRDVKEAYDFLLDIYQNPTKKQDYNLKLNSLIQVERHRRGTDIKINLKLSSAEIASEVTKNIITSRMVHCSECNGTGCSSKNLTHCYKCNGTGIDLISAIMGPKKVCTICKGFGNYQEKPDCKKCNGSGLVPENIIRHLKINRNFQPTIIIPQSGNFPIEKLNPGDLIISLLVDKKNGALEIDGRNIKGQLKISPSQAVLGDCIFMDVFGTPTKIVIPPGSCHNDIIEKKESGIVKNNKKGSLLLKVIIDIPSKITEEEKSLYIQLLKLQKG
jgi:molecular chaperone DnaJ